MGFAFTVGGDPQPQDICMYEGLGLLGGTALKNGVRHLTLKLRLLNNTFLPGGEKFPPREVPREVLFTLILSL